MWARNSGLKNKNKKQIKKKNRERARGGVEQEGLEHHYPLNGKQGDPVALLCQRSQPLKMLSPVLGIIHRSW
jgi:hypothetical protein